MINNLIDLFTNSSNLVNTFLIDVLKESIYLLMTVDFLNKITEELNEVFIFEIDTEE